MKKIALNITERIISKRSYEGIYILKPTASLDEQKQIFQKIKKTLEDFEGSIHKVDTWGDRALANAIDGKYERALYFHVWFESKPDGIQEIERKARIEPSILRFYHTRLGDKKSISEHEVFFKEIVLKQAQEFLERKQTLGPKKFKKPAY